MPASPSTASSAGRSTAASPASRRGPARRARVGGAVFGNAHFRGRLISELIERVRLVDDGGVALDVPAADMEFGYDYSRLHRTREVVLSADFRVAPGDPAALRAVARESLAFRKRTQPLESPSAGCIFQNPEPVGRSRAGRHPVLGRRARRSRRTEGRAAGRCAGVGDARQLHRERRGAIGRRHPRLIERCKSRRARAVRRRAARRDRVPGIGA